MSLIVENGSGLTNADSYQSVDDVSAYLASFGLDATWLDAAATVTLLLTVQPASSSTVVIAGKTYTFNAVLSPADGLVKIGATVADTQVNLVAAVNLGPGAGTKYGAGMTVNPNVTAADFSDGQCVLTAKVGGTAGNAFTLVSDENGTVSFTGGKTSREIACRVATQALDAEYGPRLMGVKSVFSQALQFPRTGLRPAGYGWQGYYIDSTVIPKEWKQAHAELALRAISGALIPDQDFTGRVQREAVSVGPISTDTTYMGSGKVSKKTYELVERLVSPFISAGLTFDRA